MPYAFSAPIVAETHSIHIRAFTYNADTQTFSVTVTHYDASGFEVKTETKDFPAMDSGGNVIMPSGWPSDYPSGETIYGLMKLALYGRYKEAAVITQDGTLTG